MEVAPRLTPLPRIADSSLRTVRALPAAAGAPDGLLPPVRAGHEYDMSGVFATAPRDAPGPGAALLRAPHCRRPAVPCAVAELTRGACAVTWRESVVIGHTSLEPHEVQDVVQQLGYEFRGNSYHLLERNCARPPPGTGTGPAEAAGRACRRHCRPGRGPARLGHGRRRREGRASGRAANGAV